MLLAGFFILSPQAVHSQAVHVKQGAVTYHFSADEAGEMYFSSDGNLHILQKAFPTDGAAEIWLDYTEVTPSAVQICWNGQDVRVDVSGNVARYLQVSVDGADVSVVQTADLPEEISYTLSGESSDGSFYMDGELKATLVLNGLKLSNADDFAVCIDNGKRIAIVLPEGTDNALADGPVSTSGRCKGALMVNGHSEFSGAGRLTLSGNYKHAFWADEYVKLKASLGEIVVDKAVGDGFNINQYFQQNGGTLRISGVGSDGIQVSTDSKQVEHNGMALLYGGYQEISVAATAGKALKADGSIVFGETTETAGGNYVYTTSGNGTYDTAETDIKSASCVKSGAHILIHSGTIACTSTGTGGKGLSADSTLTVDGGTLTVQTSGKRYTYSSSKTTSPKGIKADGAISILGGSLTATTTGGEGAEAIESKQIFTMEGGEVKVKAYDDGINSALDLTVKGGTLTAISTNNDGLDANRNIYIQGGTVASYGGNSPECGIDAAEGYAIYFTGGTILSLGGQSAAPSNSSSTQPYVSVSASLTASTTVSLSSSTGVLAEFTVPADYGTSSPAFGPGGGGGFPPGGSSGSSLLLSAPGLVTGQTYTVTYGSSSTTATAVQYGSSGGGGWPR